MAWDQGSRVTVLPTVPFGVNTGQMDIYMTINMNPSTQQAILEDVVECLEGYGVEKLLLVNGHGGNDFRQIIREVGSNYPDIFIATCNWFQSMKWCFFRRITNMSRCARRVSRFSSRSPLNRWSRSWARAFCAFTGMLW